MTNLTPDDATSYQFLTNTTESIFVKPTSGVRMANVWSYLQVKLFRGCGKQGNKMFYEIKISLNITTNTGGEP